MKIPIKPTKIDFSKVANTLEKAANDGLDYIKQHKIEFLTGISITAIIDNIRVRFRRKKDQQAFEQSAILQQEIVRKHEAEINVLREEADAAHEAVKRVDQLEQIVNNLVEGSASE